MKDAPQKPYNPPFLKLIVLISAIYLLYYLWWRATSTLNPQALFFSWVLWAAEAFGVLSYLLFSWITKDISPKYPHKPPSPGISVDVFIPTYNESIEVLEATLTGCRCLTYPHQTYVLDDGRREEVRKLAERFSCGYITRPTNEHAKAGNINHALQHTSGEFIVILDADMIPRPDFIERTLGYFEQNPKLAFIQLPQEFYNLDSIQHAPNASNWHEQSLFYRVIQPGKNYSNSAFWCGSPSIVRRKALEDVCGVATETVTEDIHTSVRLHSRGWDSLFVNEVLAYGIAPQTIEAFQLQRLRWAQGTMQLYRSKESPLWIPNLTIKQRLSYLSSYLAYFESFQKLILLLTPVFIIVFNVYPMNVRALDFLYHWLPYFALNYLANQVGGRGYFQYFKTEKYNLLKMIVFIQSTLTLFTKRPIKFRVTPKSVDGNPYKRERLAMRSFMVILGILSGTVIYGLGKTVLGGFSDGNLNIYLIAVFWASYNAAILLTSIKEVLTKRHERKQYRFKANVDGILYDPEQPQKMLAVHIVDISIHGAGLSSKQEIPPSQNGWILGCNHNRCGCLELPIAKVAYKAQKGSDNWQIGVQFGDLSTEQRDALLEFLFVDLAYRQFERQESATTDALALQRAYALQPMPIEMQESKNR